MSNMGKLAGIWRDQCRAAEDIMERFGVEKALGYLIGEKLMNFVQAAEQHSEFEEELPEFITEIKSIFQPWEISEYLENVKRVGALGHVCTDEEYEDFKNAGAVLQDIDFGINDILTLGKIQELLLR
ncbi:MAG: hypothetical protein V1789_05135 [PVC group bacterium]